MTTSDALPFDPSLPQSLKTAQQWFASIISRPIDHANQMVTISPTGVPMDLEAQIFIQPSPTMLPHERIELYNQQYWWRLLTIMQDSHPFVVRLFGLTDFNESIAFPYLVKYPPDHWSLNTLGDRLPQWIREDYQVEDKRLVLDAARLDCAFMRSFVARQGPRPQLPQDATTDDLEDLLDQKLKLQPHVARFALRYPLFKFRETIVNQEDENYWMTHDFPPLPKEKTYTILYRTAQYDLAWLQIGGEAYRYLSLFQKGCSINQSLQWLEEQSGALAEEIGSQLQGWLKEWIALGWFAKSR